MRILARHKRWVEGATISESVNEDGSKRRFTATIRGWQNWKIYEGNAISAKGIIQKVLAIRDRIDKGDETVFYEPNQFDR